MSSMLDSSSFQESETSLSLSDLETQDAETETAPGKPLPLTATESSAPHVESSMLDAALLEETGPRTAQGESVPVKTQGSGKRPGRPLSASSEPASQLLDRHCKNFERAFGEPYMPMFAKDIRLAKDMLRVYPLARLLELDDAFFASRDEFIQGSDHGFGVFRSTLNKLISKNPKRRAASSQGRIALGTRMFSRETRTEQVYKIFTETGWVEERVPKPVPQEGA